MPSNVISLNLSHNDIDSECIGLMAMSQLKYTLQILNLSNTPLMDRSAGALFKFLQETKINRVNLAKTQLKLKGVLAVLSALKRNQYVTHLYLQGNEWETEDYTHLLRFFEVNFTLKYISLQSCKLGKGAMKAIGKGLGINKALKSIDLSDNMVNDDEFGAFVDGISGNTHLKYLDLSNNSLKQEDSSKFEKLITNTGIESFNFKSNFMWDNVGKFVLKYSTELINQRKESLSTDQDSENTKSLVVPLRFLKIQLEQNTIKLTLLKQIRNLLKSQSASVPEKIIENPFDLFHERESICTKIESLKYESYSQLKTVKERECKMDKVKETQVSLRTHLDIQVDTQKQQILGCDNQLEELDYQFKIKEALYRKQIDDLQQRTDIIKQGYGFKKIIL